jgi:hypothetical protein
MNQETEKNINEAIDWLQETGASVQDFAVEQAPLYCREVVAWELWSGVAGGVLGIAVILVGLWLLSIGRALLRCGNDRDAFFPMLGGIIASVVGSVILSGSASHAIKAAAAPRLVIVEHLRGMK